MIRLGCSKNLVKKIGCFLFRKTSMIYILNLLFVLILPSGIEGFGIGGVWPDYYGEHGDINKEGLKGFGFSDDALKRINKAGAGQDINSVLKNKPERHFDRDPNNPHETAFNRSKKYLRLEIDDFLNKLSSSPPDYEGTLDALGRALHTVQDAFSHSNYCDIVDEKNEKKEDPINFRACIICRQGLSKLPSHARFTAYPDGDDSYRYTHSQYQKDTEDNPQGPKSFDRAKDGAEKATKEFVDYMRELLLEKLNKDQDKFDKIWNGLVVYKASLVYTPRGGGWPPFPPKHSIRHPMKNVFEMTVENPSDSLFEVFIPAGTVFESTDPMYQAVMTLVQVDIILRPGQKEMQTLEWFCLDRNKRLPPTGDVTKLYTPSAPNYGTCTAIIEISIKRQYKLPNFYPAEKAAIAIPQWAIWKINDPSLTIDALKSVVYPQVESITGKSIGKLPSEVMADVDAGISQIWNEILLLVDEAASKESHLGESESQAIEAVLNTITNELKDTAIHSSQSVLLDSSVSLLQQARDHFVKRDVKTGLDLLAQTASKIKNLNPQLSVNLLMLHDVGYSAVTTGSIAIFYSISWLETWKRIKELVKEFGPKIRELLKWFGIDELWNAYKSAGANGVKFILKFTGKWGSKAVGFLKKWLPKLVKLPALAGYLIGIADYVNDIGWAYGEASVTIKQGETEDWDVYIVRYMAEVNRILKDRLGDKYSVWGVFNELFADPKDLYEIGKDLKDNFSGR